MAFQIPPYTFQAEPEEGLSFGELVLAGLGILAGAKLLQQVFSTRSSCDAYKYLAIASNRIVHGGIVSATVAKFQSDHKLPRNGELDFQTRKALNVRSIRTRCYARDS